MQTHLGHTRFAQNNRASESAESTLLRGPLNGGGSNGGASRSGLVLPFLSFFVLFGTFPIFWDFPDLFRDSPRIFPICPFPLSRPINSTCEEQSRKGPRDNPGKMGNPPVWKPPGLASLNYWLRTRGSALFQAQLGEPFLERKVVSPQMQNRHWSGQNRHFCQS